MNITLYWENESGLEVRRTLRFERGSYLILQEQHLINQRGSDWQGAFYQQLKRTPPAKKKGFMGARSFDGAAFLNEKKHYAKATFEQISKGEIPQLSLTSGWLAMLQHYFVSAWIPPQDLSYTLYTRHQPQGDFHFIGMHTQPVTVSAGSDHRFRSQLYVGPKTQDQLKTIAPLLERTVDYGKLTFIAEPLFYILKTINSVIGNWGWSIILLTTLIKLLFFKLSEKSYRSMANMRQLSPKLKQLKERYGEDKQKLNQAVMELYKKEKINPLGGCLPILIQMPVFISLYWMLLETVELRQAPFMFWIQDLSVRDPFFILPLIMGATMVLQQRLNPAPMDPTQQKVMMLMPIMFTGMFLFFPSGLVLYWVVNNTLSIAQQWLIIKRIENKKS
jgi:YidC/Oxa1 family membrane protein insertase